MLRRALKVSCFPLISPVYHQQCVFLTSNKPTPLKLVKAAKKAKLSSPSPTASKESMQEAAKSTRVVTMDNKSRQLKMKVVNPEATSSSKISPSKMSPKKQSSSIAIKSYLTEYEEKKIPNFSFSRSKYRLSFQFRRVHLYVLEDGKRMVVYTDGACSNNGNAKAVAGIGIFWGKDHPL